MRLSLWYKRLVFLLVLLLPVLGTGFLRLTADPKDRFWYGHTHQILILTAVALAAALGYVAFRSYRMERSSSLRFIALGYFGFALLYSFHGFFTPLAHGHLLLFTVFGPVSRLVMCAYVYAGLLQLLRGKSPDVKTVPASWWLRHLAVFAVLGLAAGYAAQSGLLTPGRIKLIESLALALSLLGATRLMLLRKRSDLLHDHLLAQLYFAQTSLAFILSSPWNGLWWFAHAVSAAGFMILGYAVVRSYEQTDSVGSAYEETLLYPVLQSILQTSHEGIVMTDLQGNIRFANRRIADFFPDGLERGKPVVLFLNALKLKSAASTPPVHLAEELLAGRLEEIDENVELPGGADGPDFYELYAAPVADNRKGSRIGYLFVFRNRTKEERLNQLKNDFIGVVSHELRTPMASILGFTEIMLIRDVPPEKRTKYLQTIHNEANRLSNLINDFLDIQRIESGRQQYQLHPVDAGELVAAVVEQWQGKEAHLLRLEAPSEPVYAVADAERMLQVLHNLVSNAVKYSPGAEYVDLSLGRSESGEAVIRVRDYGLGIPESSLPHLFKRFYRVESTDHRKIRGTGLGLTICKEIVEAHQGRIEVESVPGQGSVFTVRLPAYKLPGLEGKLAVLEDGEGRSELLRMLPDHPYGEVIRFTGAEEALFVLDRTGERPWLWMADIRLEGRTDGWSFIRRLKRHPLYREGPLAVFTLPFHPGGEEAGLRKPYGVRELLQALGQLRADSGPGCLLIPCYSEQDLIELLHKQGLEIDSISRSAEGSLITLKGDAPKPSGGGPS